MSPAVLIFVRVLFIYYRSVSNGSSKVLVCMSLCSSLV